MKGRQNRFTVTLEPHLIQYLEDIGKANGVKKSVVISTMVASHRMKALAQKERALDAVVDDISPLEGV